MIDLKKLRDLIELVLINKGKVKIKFTELIKQNNFEVKLKK